MSEYKRLSDEELTDAISRIVVQLNQRLTMQFLSITEELIQYREKFINGQLIELPCKVGDTVYEVFKEHRPPFIQETKIEKIVIVGEKGLRLRLARNSFYETAISSLGKTVFLTKAEAEARLKELQENKK